MDKICPTRISIYLKRKPDYLVKFHTVFILVLLFSIALNLLITAISTAEASEKENLHLVILFDKSSSMNSEERPNIWKPAANFLIEALDTYNDALQQSVNKNVQVAFIPFDVGVHEAEILPFDTPSHEVINAFKAETIRATDFIPPLLHAKAILEQVRKGKKLTYQTIIILSDGLPNTEKNNLLPDTDNIEKYFAEHGEFNSLIEEFKKLKIAIHLLAIKAERAKVVANTKTLIDGNIVENGWKMNIPAKHFMAINEDKNIKGQIRAFLRNIFDIPQIKTTQEKDNIALLFRTFEFSSPMLLLPIFFLLRTRLRLKKENVKLQQNVDSLKKHERDNKQTEIEDELERENVEIAYLTSDSNWLENTEKKEKVFEIFNKISGGVENLRTTETDRIIEKFSFNPFEKILRALTDKNESWQFIYNLVQEEQDIKVKTLKKHVVDTWQKKPKDFDLHVTWIYNVANNTKNKPLVFKELGNHDFKDQGLNEIKDFCGTIAKILLLTRADSESKQKEGMVMCFRFFNRSRYLFENMTLPECGAKFYLSLLGLFETLENTIYPGNDIFFFSDTNPKEKSVNPVETDESVNLLLPARNPSNKDLVLNSSPPNNWHKSIERLRKIAQVDSKNQLEAVIKTLHKDDPIGPDDLFFNAIFKKWLKETGKWNDKPADLQVELLPNLSFTNEHKEEDLSDFWVSVKNKGEGNAIITTIEIIVDLEVRLDQFDEYPHTTLGVGDRFLSQQPVVVGGFWRSIQVVVRYKDCQKKGLSSTSRVYKKRYSKNTNRDFRDPYQYDSPYRNTFNIFEGRKKELDEFTNIVHFNRPGRATSLWGIRGIGKTSLINYFSQKLLEDGEGKNLIAYFCCSKFVRNESWSVENFLAEISKEIVENLSKNGVSIKHNKNCDSLVLKDFETLVMTLRNSKDMVGKNLILIFDNIEILFQDIEHPQNKKILFSDFDKIISCLIDFANYREGSAGFYPIFVCCNGALPEQVPALNQTKRIVLRGVEKKQMKAISEKAELNLDGLALDFLWHVTGGHPALIQLICQKVYQEMLLKNEGFDISNSYLKSIVQNLVLDQDFESYFRYLYTYSFKEKARHLLENLMRERKISEVTLEMDLEGLTTPEKSEIRPFYEQNGDSYRLQIGIFKLLFEKWENSL